MAQRVETQLPIERAWQDWSVSDFLDWLKLGLGPDEPRVRVLVSPETSWVTAVALLRRIADWIESEGLAEFDEESARRR